MREQFADGNMSEVYRLGDVVQKTKGPWWDATRQVLQHLEAVGYPWSPRIVSDNDTTVDLTFIDGKTIPASLEHAEHHQLLRVIGTRVRELHDAVDGFRLEPHTDTVPWPIRPPENLIICHNDLSPWNTVMRSGEFEGFIDWDLVSYGSREWELAWVCWRWAPIYPDNGRSPFTARRQIERCRVILDAYGREALNLTGFVNLIDQRMHCALEVVEQLGAQGVPGFDRLLSSGMHLSGHDDRAWLARHNDEFQSGIEVFQV